MKKRNRTWKCALSAALACALLLGTLPAAAFATDGPGLTPPAATTVPEATAAPEATAMPEGFEEPKAMEEPKATEEPKAAEEPESTPAPQMTEDPEATAEPSPEPEGTPAPETAPENELLLAQPQMLAQKNTVIEETANLTELNIWVDELGLTHYEDSVGRGRFDGFVVADWTGKWSSSDETVVSFGTKTGLYATFVAVNPGSAVITHTGEGFGVNRGKTYVTYYPITVTESHYAFRLSGESSPGVTVYYAADGVNGTSLQALVPGETLPVYDRAYKKNGAHFYVSVPAGYTGNSSFEHRSGDSEAELGGFDSGSYGPLDDSAAANAARAQGASRMFEYNRFYQDGGYRFREFRVTAEPVDITVEFRDGDNLLQSSIHHHSNLGLGDDRITFPEEPQKDGYSFVGWRSSSNDHIYSGAGPSVDSLWTDTSETAVTYILTPVWSEEQPEYEMDGLPANGKLQQVYNGSPIWFNPALTYGGQPVDGAQFTYEKKNGAGNNYTALAEKPSVTHVDESCTIRVTASVNGREVARSGDIRLTVTPRAIQLVGSYILNHIYTGEPRIMDSEDDLRYIVDSYRNGNTKERGLIVEKDRLALVNGKKLPESTDVRSTTTYNYPISSFKVYDRETGLQSKDYKLMGKNGKVSITLEILPRTVEITLQDAQKVYGESDPAAFTYSAETALALGGQLYDRDKLVPGHSVQLADGEDLEREAGDEVKNGGYAILGRAEQFRILDQAGSDVTANYNVTVKSGSFTIEPRPVTVYIQDAAKTAGQADPAFTAKAEPAGEGHGLLQGHTLGVVENGLTRAAGETAGTYPITPANPEKAGESFEVLAAGQRNVTGNYVFEAVPGSLTISAAPAPTPGPGTDTTPTATPAPAVIPPPPAGPAAAVPPAAAEEEIPDEEIPLAEAPEASPAPTQAPAEEEEDIADDEVPLAAGAGGAWALLNLLLAVFTVLGSALLLITWATGKKRRELESETEQQRRRHGLMRLVSLVPAVASVAAFLLTENMRLPMAFADKWTILMAILAAAQLAVMFLARKNWEDQGDDNGQGAAPANA